MKKEKAITSKVEKKSSQEVAVVKPKQEMTMYQQQSTSVENMIMQAIQNNVPVETMERVLAMRKELKAEFAKEQFDKAMADFQAEIPDIQKTKEVKNDAGKLLYKYAPLDTIIGAVKGILAKHELSYSIKTEVQKDSVKSIVFIKHSAGHSESSEMETPLATKTGIMSQPQQIAATATFSKRYAFMNALGIMTAEEDNEENLEKTAPAGKVSQSEKEKAFAALDMCMTRAEMKKVWSTLSKEQQADKEIIIHANDIISNIDNENSSNGSAN